MSCIPWWFNIEWRTRKRVILLLCAFEFIPTIATLVFFGIADPDTYRTKLWQEGADHGWNSSPIELLYAAANYKPINPPMPWSQFVNDFGIAISVLSTFVLLVKIVLYLTHVFPPVLSAVLHGAFAIMWAYAASIQAAPDYSDPLHPSPRPWYLTHGCGADITDSLRGYCQQAIAAFSFSIVQALLFTVYFVFSVISAFPSEEQKKEQREKEREAQEWKDIENYENKDFEQELDQMHLPPNPHAFNAYPMSPSKMVFGVQASELKGPAPMVTEHRLTQSNSSNGSAGSMARINKDLPLRHHLTSDVYA